MQCVEPTGNDALAALDAIDALTLMNCERVLKKMKNSNHPQAPEIRQRARDQISNVARGPRLRDGLEVTPAQARATTPATAFPEVSVQCVTRL